MNQKHIAGIILAAGGSTRMGQTKALLPLGESNFISVIMENLTTTGFSPLIVVLGTNYKSILKNLPSPSNIKYIRNPSPENGQLSSLRLAIKQLPVSSDGCLVSLVDHPLVAASTYNLIFQEASKSPDKIVIPVYNGKRGHPVYFSRDFFGELLSAALDAGARQVVKNHPQSAIELPVDDPGILKDIDTPEIYRKHIS